MNRLINPIKTFTAQGGVMDRVPASPFMAQSTWEIARHFVGTLDESQVKRMKKMLKSGAIVGESVAQAYGLNPDEFADALKEVI